MQERSSKPKRPRGANQFAFQVVQESIGQAPKPSPHDGKNPAAVESGRLSGLKGGKTRADKLSAEERSAIVKKTAAARWHKDQ